MGYDETNTVAHVTTTTTGLFALPVTQQAGNLDESGTCLCVAQWNNAVLERMDREHEEGPQGRREWLVLRLRLCAWPSRGCNNITVMEAWSVRQSIPTEVLSNESMLGLQLRSRSHENFLEISECRIRQRLSKEVSHVDMSANKMHTNFALPDVIPSLKVAQVEVLRTLGRRHRVIDCLCRAFVVNEDGCRWQ